MKNKIDWKNKIASRKFWALITAVVVSVLTGIARPETVAQVTGIVTAVGACVVYMLAEAKVDAANAGMYLPMIEDDENDTAAH